MNAKPEVWFKALVLFFIVYKPLTVLLHWRNPHFVAVACASAVKVFVVIYDLSEGVPMHIEINDPVKTVQQITPAEYNTQQINLIKDIYPHLRQKAKAPVFA